MNACVTENFNEERRIHYSDKVRFNLLYSNIRMDFKGIGINVTNCIAWAQVMDYWGALVNAVLNLRVLQAMELSNH